MQIQWKSSSSASCLYAAWQIAQGEAIVDQALLEALAPHAAKLEGVISQSGAPRGKFWRTLMGLASEYGSNRQLAEVVLAKVLGRNAAQGPILSPLITAMDSIEATMLRQLPRLAQELPLRGGPIREQWEARGPGLVRMVSKLTEEALIPGQASVVVVHPVSGGGCENYLEGNVVIWEGLLANAEIRLPEVVRLGWSLLQLQMDLPMFSEQLLPGRTLPLARLALVPAVLQAAAEVELVHVVPGLLAMALKHWKVLPIEVDSPVVGLLEGWWQDYLQNRPSWGNALMALDQLLGDGLIVD
ncbi:MAG: hypothetical protein ACO1RA_07605 [Planctomycetaceae bacterium]